MDIYTYWKNVDIATFNVNTGRGERYSALCANQSFYQRLRTAWHFIKTGHLIIK
jgi:hypothetical protein